MAWVLDELIEQRQVTPVFVPMEPPYDTNVSKKILAKMQHADATKLLGEQFTPNQFYNFIGQTDLTLALRLHALIFAALSNIPHIGLSYDRKVESFLKRSGMWKHSFPLEDFTKEALLTEAIYTLDHAADVKAMMEPNVEVLRQEARRNVTLLKEKFGRTAK